MTGNKIDKRISRHKKIRTKISGTSACPRLAVYKSNRFFTAQLIDDTKGVTLVASGDLGKSAKSIKGTKTARAQEVGKTIAKLAGEKKIKTVVFDRAGFLYAGRVKAFADAVREGGLKF
jgi:large subunit ribosomal protein L18